ncbi:MAG: hypothetical protein MJ240_03470 [Kiritimatiellae bacterium]|nr:hypothetical protein [Kiritimatiellia bacterium]
MSKAPYLPFVIACGLVLLLHIISSAFTPWMDEVHIVEMGRLAVGSCTESILISPNGMSSAPLYYLGPMCHELAFRMGGVYAVRILPALALCLTAIFFHLWIVRSRRFPEGLALVFSFVVLTLPIFVQSVRMVRVDMAVMAICFLILFLIDRPHDQRSRLRLVGASLLAASSPFLWPSAVMLFPLYWAIWFSRLRDARRSLPDYGIDIGVGGLVALLTVSVFLIPVRDQIPRMLDAFNAYFSGAGASSPVGNGAGVSCLEMIRGMVVLAVKESTRAPFFVLVLPVGFVCILRRAPLIFGAYLVALGMGVLTGLHTFRNIFLFPYLLFFFCEAIVWILPRWPSCVRWYLIGAVGYGFLLGPVAYAFWSRPERPIESSACSMLPAGTRVVSLDYAAYYLGRQNHWHLMAYPRPSQIVEDPAHLLRECQAVVLPPICDHYCAIEESYTLYGGLRSLCLSAARYDAAQGKRSFLGQIGEAFTYDDFPQDTRDKLLSRLTEMGFSFSGDGRIAMAGGISANVH